MLRFLASLAVLTGCTFSDGTPWGRIERAELSIELSVPDGRLDTQGRFKTSLDYRIELTSLRVDYTRLSVSTQAKGTKVFDPAQPPAGCTLCHNGHCHCDAELVAYEDLAVQASAGGSEVTLGINRSLDALNDTKEIELDACTAGACDLPRGALSAVTVGVTMIQVEGTVWDARGTPRFENAMPFIIQAQLSDRLQGPLEGVLDRTSGWMLHVTARHEIDETFFDGIDWANHLTQGAWPEQTPIEVSEYLQKAMTERATLHASVR